MAKLNKEAESRKSSKDQRPSGKQLFMLNKRAFDDIEINEDDLKVVEEEIKNDEEETKDNDGEEQEEEFKYDRALFDPESLVDEDVDFD
mmetsp:Transcript_37791/g.27489  ORF Transcript_37791/g.27489 Transcript_37791/m.27489 type:complete len:89 (+) Transcript_37791:502-768(+)|eukprot:CAMPEP_0116885428 /NCGR_PEP_ID=MMETSP0463-20121206/18772_1 /TAXON_ID=181622 /ORGANISM="Strombidinopsis sp, Strain SopsisLIS2011" /LENGTH=88 /DNA_ID=CAMNT_0004543827 /DNA_START=502 /DNA_END=768 /DNA_ORIENTATION=+